MRGSWTDTTLGDVIKLGGAGSWGSDEAAKDLVEAHCLRGTDIAQLIDGRHPDSPRRWLTVKELEKSQCKEDMILIETSGACGRAVLVTGQILEKFSLPVVFSNFCRILTIDPDRLTAKYAELWLSNAYATGLMNHYRRTTAIPNLDIKSLLEVERINLPPVTEQRRIVNVMISIDAYIAALQRQEANAWTARNAVLHEMLAAGQAHWTEKTLGNTLDISRGGSPRPIQAFITDREDGVNWVKIGDASNSSKYIYKTKEKIKKSGVEKSRAVKSGDFILSNSMSFGRPYIMRCDGCIHDGWLLLSNVATYFDEDFLYNLLMSDYVQTQFNSFAAGSGVRNLNIDAVKQVVVSIPPLSTQKEIASIANALDEFLWSLKRTAQRAKELRQSMLIALLSREHEIPESYDRLLGAA